MSISRNCSDCIRREPPSSTRAKKNLAWHRVYSSPKDREHGIQADQLIALDGKRTQQAYPLHLRRVRYQDPDSGKRLVFLTNRRDLAAVTVLRSVQAEVAGRAIFSLDEATP